MDLVETVYQITAKLPASEQWGLISQMRRAAVSVPSNIAEGYGRQHRGEYIQHLSMSNGSLKELETQALICVRLKRLEKSQTEAFFLLAEELGRMLTALIRSLKNPRA